MFKLKKLKELGKHEFCLLYCHLYNKNYFDVITQNSRFENFYYFSELIKLTLEYKTGEFEREYFHAQMSPQVDRLMPLRVDTPPEVLAEHKKKRADIENYIEANYEPGLLNL